MGLFGKKIEPLKCTIQDVLDLMDECIKIDAPCLDMTIKSATGKHSIGISSDFEAGKYFDTLFFFDDNEYESIEQMVKDENLYNEEIILVLKEEGVPDPRDYTLLAEREIK